MRFFLAVLFASSCASSSDGTDMARRPGECVPFIDEQPGAGMTAWVRGIAPHYSLTGLASDGHGNWFVTGTINELDSARNDPFLMGLRPDGTWHWGPAIGSNGMDEGGPVVADGRGGMLAAITIRGPIHLGEFPGSSGPGVALLRFAANRCLRSTLLGFGGRANGLGVDGVGNVYLTVGPSNLIVASFALDGTRRWLHSTGLSTDAEPNGLAVDRAGEVTVLGRLGADRVAMRWSGDGDLRWSRTLGPAETVRLTAIAPASGGEVVLAGALAGPADLGTGPLAVRGGTDLLLARLGSDGAPRWAWTCGGAGDDAFAGVTVPEAGGVLAVGSFVENLDCAKEVGIPYATGRGALITRHDETGRLLVASRLGEIADNRASLVATDGGRILVGLRSTDVPALGPGRVLGQEAGYAPITTPFVASIDDLDAVRRYQQTALTALTVVATGPGIVRSIPERIDCGARCVASFMPGTRVALPQQPDPGAAISTSTPVLTRMEGPTTVVAEFGYPLYLSASAPDCRPDYTSYDVAVVTAQPAGKSWMLRAQGSSTKQVYVPGAVSTLTVAPLEMAKFLGWDTDCVGMGPCVVTMDRSRSVVARFDAACLQLYPPMDSLLRVGGPMGGSGFICDWRRSVNNGCSLLLPWGMTWDVTLSTKKTFFGWQGACVGLMPTCTVTVAGKIWVRADAR